MTAVAIDPAAALAALADPAGGWGYAPDQGAHLEPTVYAILALTTAGGHADAVEAGLRAIHTHARPDGSYRLTRGRPEAAWPTALVLLLHTRAGAPADVVARTADCLLALEGRVVKDDPEVADMLDIDLRLLGWPWAESTFSWVEPTAWACLGLRAAGRGGHPRVGEGLRLLIDRAFDAGGVNYGNRVVLGKPTDPIPGPTAAMLLALQGVTDELRVDAACGYLRTHARAATDLEHLSWVALALAAHAHDPANADALPGVRDRVRAAVDAEHALADGLGGGPLRLALASLALGDFDAGPFKLTDAPKIAAGGTLGAKQSAAVTGPVAGERRSFGERVKSAARGVLANGLGRLKPLPPTSAVHVARVDSYDGPLLDTLRAQYEHFRTHVPVAGKRVVLKPNLVEFSRTKVINTDPRVMDALIRLFQGEGAAEVIVAEGPGHWRNAQYLVNESGLGDVLRARGVRFVDLNHDEPVKVLNLGRCTGLEYLYLSRTVLSADVFVSVPKLKTHHWAGATLALKNLFGTLPGICYGWPKNELHWRGIPNSVVDIACTHTPHLAIIDGIVGMEGDGPLNGSARHVGALVMGVDLVAVDATGCRLMGLPPHRVPTLALAQAKRLGHLVEARIPQLGEAVAALAQDFVRPPAVDKQLLPEVADAVGS